MVTLFTTIFFNYYYINIDIINTMDDNVTRPDPFRPEPHKARTLRAGLPRLARFMRVAITGPSYTSLGPLFFFFFF